MTTKPKNPVGRPSGYTPEKAEKFCALIMQGKTFRDIEKVDGLPKRDVICDWLHRHAEFADQYARAMEVRALVQTVDLDEMSDDPDAKKEEDSAVKVARDKLRINTRQWTMERMARKHLAPGSKVEMTGKDGADLIPKQTPAEIEARIAQLSAENPGLLESLIAKNGGNS